MSLEKYIKVYPAIPDPTTIGKFIQYLNKTFNDKKFVSGSIAGGHKKKDIVDKKVRDVEILGLDSLNDSLSNVHWFNYINYLIVQQMSNYIREFPDIREAGIMDMQALRYGIGGHYQFHVDDGPTFNRKYSCILMLNNDFEGGNLCFNLDGKIIKMETKPGHVVIWPSNFMFPHAVEPLTKGVRYSVVSWMR
jgi:Rps23 Pro-64 3,4-dihydroxylase Tpa1-like proline 4-hydroxylase|tara:strand:- start:1012 stop:1587 length:576 start_codon:yes stop_codon:yes gene_type:complete